MERVGEYEEEGVKESVVLKLGPDTKVWSAVLDGDWLQRNARLEPASPEPGEVSPVSGGALGEYEELRPGQRRQSSVHNVSHCPLSTLLGLPGTQN